MEFDWNYYVSDGIKHEEVAQSFEDGFSLRFIPAGSRFDTDIRFFSLGTSLAGTRVFSVYTTSGTVLKVIAARIMTLEEERWYLHHANKL